MTRRKKLKQPSAEVIELVTSELIKGGISKSKLMRKYNLAPHQFSQIEANAGTYTDSERIAALKRLKMTDLGMFEQLMKMAYIMAMEAYEDRDTGGFQKALVSIATALDKKLLLKGKISNRLADIDISKLSEKDEKFIANIVKNL